MTLVESINAMAQALTQFLSAQQPAGGTLGMTDVEAQAFADLKAQVATLVEQTSGIKSSLQTVIQTQAGHATTLASLGSGLTTVTTDVATLKAGIGDLSQLGGQ